MTNPQSQFDLDGSRKLSLATNSTLYSSSNGTSPVISSSQSQSSSLDGGLVITDNNSEINREVVVHMVVVRQNDRIKFDCVSNLAKPHAEVSLVKLSFHNLLMFFSKSSF